MQSAPSRTLLLSHKSMDGKFLFKLVRVFGSGLGQFRERLRIKKCVGFEGTFIFQMETRKNLVLIAEL